ncbi:hypothetical protein EXIGLDRAFT_729373 [Exidia glandulosa HHB12029]|uniref:Uncharacterized protein n=1 Tax=Exidia glandulosa HHB12029 TaxID=1314781 RepID=A0A165CL85_EXIGL|nr:hypothetical protein EXIGLDRAFT_729373 [Exidia glandulosa HHB12029]
MAGRARLGLVAAGPNAAIFAAASAASLPGMPSCPGAQCIAMDFVEQILSWSCARPDACLDNAGVVDGESRPVQMVEERVLFLAVPIQHRRRPYRALVRGSVRVDHYPTTLLHLLRRLHSCWP